MILREESLEFIDRGTASDDQFATQLRPTLPFILSCSSHHIYMTVVAKTKLGKLGSSGSLTVYERGCKSNISRLIGTLRLIIRCTTLLLSIVHPLFVFFRAFSFSFSNPTANDG